MDTQLIVLIVVLFLLFGGIVIRWILSNPTYDSRYQGIINKIKWVNSIAAPNAGSEAANLAGAPGFEAAGD
jgi:capsular polysaccharide biosynthesis protein